MSRNALFGIVAVAFSMVFLYLSSFLVSLIIEGFDQSGAKLATVEALRASGKNTFPGVYPNLRFGSSDLVFNRDIFPLGGISDVTTVFCREAGDIIVYESDEHGFHNPPGAWKESGADILAIGNSYAQGACVPSDANMISFVRREWPRTVSLAAMGNGPLAELGTLREYGHFLRPKVVLWFYGENDIGLDFSREKTSKILSRYATDRNYSQHLLRRQPEIDKLLRGFSENQVNISFLNREAAKRQKWKLRFRLFPLRVAFSKLIVFLQLRWGIFHFGVKTPPDDFELPQLDVQPFLNLLAKAQSEAQSWGGNLYFVYVPDSKDFGAEKLPIGSRDPDQYHLELVQSVKALSIPVIDLEAFFRSQPDPLHLYANLGLYRGHFNEDGYRVAGTFIVKSLEEMGALGAHGLKHSALSTQVSR